MVNIIVPVDEETALRLSERARRYRLSRRALLSGLLRVFASGALAAAPCSVTIEEEVLQMFAAAADTEAPRYGSRCRRRHKRNI